MPSHGDEADALRSDLAACLRALSGDATAEGPGFEALVAAFVGRAGRLQRAFAVAALQEECRDDGDEAAGLRAEVDALRVELAEKERLLTSHRANVQRWLTECRDVERTTTAGERLEPRVVASGDASRTGARDV